jgi:hypothetical protein
VYDNYRFRKLTLTPSRGFPHPAELTLTLIEGFPNQSPDGRQVDVGVVLARGPT